MAEKKLDSNPTLVPIQDQKLAKGGQSPFLKFQDPNGDKLPDVCDIEVVPSQQVCKDCVPNPKAISIDWTKKNQDTPFLNEKICKYQITFRTSETNTGFVEGMTDEQADEALQDIYKKYARDAVVFLLRGFGKDDAEGIIQEVLNSLEYTAYDLSYRQNSYLKLLYSVDFQQIFSLPDATSTEDEEDEEKGSDITVTYEASEMLSTSITVRKGLNLYDRFARVARAIEGKIIRFEESNKIFDLDPYGDTAFFTKKSLIGELIREVDKFLNGRGYNITNIGNTFSGLGKETVTKLDFILTPEYKLKKLKVYTVGCGSDRPDKVYGKNYVTALSNTDAWRDPTAVAYFSKMKKIESDLEARVPMPFEEFIVKHTYPKVFVQEGPNVGGRSSETIASCITDALLEDGKELGQDIFDEVFSLADAIAYRFHKNLCQTTPAKVNEESILKGLNLGANSPNDPSDVYSLAKSQAFDTINAEDSVFTQLCFRMISGGLSGVGCGLSPLQQLDQMYAKGLDRIGQCGFLDLLLEALQCLFKGLTLEQALASIIRAALKAMGVEEIGDLFIGLPLEKQRELEAAVERKLESGNIFSNGSPGQTTSDALAGQNNSPNRIALQNLKRKKPWKDKKYVEASNKNKRRDNYGNLKSSNNATPASYSQPERRTIGQKLKEPVGEDFQVNNIIIDAYIEALMEVYQDNYLELLDALNRFPGAQLIASVIALLDCPTPPLFNPGFEDFFKSLQLPFCRNINPLDFPKWENPFLYIPKLSDILSAIFEALIKLVICIIMRVIILIMAKICEIIGDAICKLLETVGQIGAGLLTGNTDILGIIRDTICGESASDEEVKATVLALAENFGVGAAAFANPERTISFFGDIVNSSTRDESLRLLMEGPSRAQIEIVNGLLDNEYTEFRDALSNDTSIETMFKNMGNIIPEAVKDEIKLGLSIGADSPDSPMNPTLCATPEALEDFYAVRESLLEGRMTPKQAKEQTDLALQRVLEDTNDLGQILNDGISSTIENAMPPIFSDPGCENGLLPFEPEESIKTATAALKADMDSLKIAYTDDMLGNGGLFAGDDDWGFMNMVLSDTMGNPYTAHQRKTFNSSRFVDFYVEEDAAENAELGNFSSLGRQRGAYPYYMAEWLKYQFNQTNGATDLGIVTFSATNDVQQAEKFTRSFGVLGFEGLFDTDVNLTEMTDFGYNVSYRVDYEQDVVEITKAARKKNPDVTLKFRDNSKGYRPTDGHWAYGFDLKAFYSDIAEYDTELKSGFFNIPNDNVRVQIREYINEKAKTSSSVEEKLDDAQDGGESDIGTTDDITGYLKYEFFAVDNSLDNIDINESTYPLLFSSFNAVRSPVAPQVLALADITGLGDAAASTISNEINSALYSTIRQTIGDPDDLYRVWLYGAEFDDLSEADIDYGVTMTEQYWDPSPFGPYQGTDVTLGGFCPYDDLHIPNFEEEEDDEGEVRLVRDGWRRPNNEDLLLGISRNQHDMEVAGTPEKTRVFYLNPTQFGQSYKSPSLYIKPIANKGWLGAINVMFPDYSPCKPRDTNLIAFDDIQKQIDLAYRRIPEDDRLKTDPDCITEVPFNRILSRPSRAGLEGLITGLIRIFVSTHFIKSLPVFATFETRFPENYSNIYASYIIENIEEACKESGGNFLNPFKDDEFWYAFLEQAVQLYSRKLDDDQDDTFTPDDVPVYIQEAIEKINRLQENYNYPDRDDFKDAPSEEKANFQSLKSFREEKNLEAIQQVEDESKLILAELVKEQLNFISELFNENLKKSGFVTAVTNTDFYFLQSLCANGEGLDMQKVVTFVEDVDSTEVDEAIATGSGYTTGNLFALPNGEPYVGDYHVHIDENGNSVFMVGEYHVDDMHDVLAPFGNNVIVKGKDPDGNVAPIGDISNIVDPAADKSFYLKKYVLIDGDEYTVEDAENLIRSKKVGNVSNHYPGSLRLLTSAIGKPYGLDGNIGVQSVLEFGVLSGGSEVPITEVRLDALDLPVNEYTGPRANSKLLLCLIDNLRDDEKFRMTVDYICSIKKALSMYAIYTDIAFMPSIGEYTVAKSTDDFKTYNSKEPARKPGVRVDVETGQVDYREGWAHEANRNGLFASPFFRKWDDWDQILLRKSVKRTKKIFKPYYTKRKFEVEDADDASPGDQFISLTVKRFKPLTGGNLLPWFKRRKLKPNPFNNKGELCKKPD